MARRKPEWLQKREYDRAVARNNYYETFVPSVTTTVVPRKMDTAIYPSVLLSKGTDIIFSKVPISSAAGKYFSGAADLNAAALKELGLRVDADFSAPVARVRGLQPAKLFGMRGTTAPTAKVSPWGSRVIKYSAATTGGVQAHYSTPIGGLAEADAITVMPTTAKIDTLVETILLAKKSDLANTSDYGRLYWTPEIVSLNKNV